ncbi:MAG: nucleotidyl transferase AbiEii/AbiGii toxin family protein [Nanoarchaeota archaeon]
MKERHGKADPGIIEKVIYALSMVEQLSIAKLNFVFKGGTSLFLLLPEPRRFSIDVDIISTESREKIETILTEITSKGVFTRWSLDEKRSYKPGIPKAHYHLYFYSNAEQKEKDVMLDVLYEKHNYPEIIDGKILSAWLKTDGDPTLVKIPTIDSITGDKLTAYAPETIGIPYGREKQMEIIKQLFDIGTLFDLIQNIETVKKSFDIVARQEIAYRLEKKPTVTDVLDNIISTSRLIAFRGNHPDDAEKTKFPEITTGLEEIKSFIFTAPFRIDEAITASAKAAYLAAIIKTNHSELLRYNTSINIGDYLITDPAYNKLNKLKNIPGGALFYWHHTLKLLSYTKGT